MAIERIGFIGGGNMAEALIKGLRQGPFAGSEILVGEPDSGRQQILTERHGTRPAKDNREVLRNCDLIFLAVKPQVIGPVLGEVAGEVTAAKLLVSILAGIATATIEGMLPGSPRVIRAMPNTPALVGAGATAICRGRHAGAADLETARTLFATVGLVQVVSEALMDVVTGLSGSGPAYVFTVIEALADGAVQEGLPREAALALATQTLLGAARLVQETGEHPAVLRDRVCSPGGTTIAGVKALEEKGLRAALMEAVSRATRRSRELGR